MRYEVRWLDEANRDPAVANTSFRNESGQGNGGGESRPLREASRLITHFTVEIAIG
jgi:hypothetical protein